MIVSRISWINHSKTESHWRALRIHILFVCAGNTCRSPMAEYLCRHIASISSIPVTVSSAGVHATTGLPMTHEAMIALEREGIEPVAHNAKRITKTHVDAASIIFVMEYHHKEAIAERFPKAISKVRLLDRLGVRDPIEQTQAVYDLTLSQIKRSLETFFKDLS